MWLSALQTWLSAIRPYPHSNVFPSAAAINSTPSLAEATTKPTATYTGTRPTPLPTEHLIIPIRPPVSKGPPGGEGEPNINGEIAHSTKTQLAAQITLRAGSRSKAKHRFN